MDNDIVLQRILERLDKMDVKLNDLCNRMTTSEVEHKTHKDFTESKLSGNQWSWNKLFGSVGIIIAIVTVTLSLL